MRPENGVWLMYKRRVSGGLLGLGWFEGGRIRWSTFEDDEDAELLDRFLEIRLAEWVGERPRVSVEPPRREAFRLSNPAHAGAFFMSFDGEPIRSGLRVHLGYNPQEITDAEPPHPTPEALTVH